MLRMLVLLVCCAFLLLATAAIAKRNKSYAPGCRLVAAHNSHRRYLVVAHNSHGHRSTLLGFMLEWPLVSARHNRHVAFVAASK